VSCYDDSRGTKTEFCCEKKLSWASGLKKIFSKKKEKKEENEKKPFPLLFLKIANSKNAWYVDRVRRLEPLDHIFKTSSS
jgi:hypothetical protein